MNESFIQRLKLNQINSCCHLCCQKVPEPTDIELNQLRPAAGDTVSLILCECMN